MEGNDVDKSIVERLRMDMDRLIDAVCEMRHAQMEFFRSRSRSALEASRRAEKKVDRLLEELRKPTLF